MGLQEKVQYQQDSRKHERVEKNLKLRFGRMETFAKDSYTTEGELLDISAGGIRLLSPEFVAINSKLVIQIDFPGWLAKDGKWIATKKEEDVAALDVLGLVIWSAVNQEDPDKFDIGVSFSDVVR